MSKPLSPPWRPVPPGFWARADVNRGLVDHDAGALLRLFRQYTGASQQALGAAIDMAQPHISAIMAGRREVTALRTWQRIAEGLDMPGESRRAIGISESPSVYDDGIRRISAPPADAADLSSATRLVREITETALKDLMKRRDALSAGGAIVIGAALTETLERWTLSKAGLLDHVVQGTIGESELRRVEAAATALRHWDDRWRLGIRRKAVVGQLSEVSELAEAPQPAAVRTRLFVVMAELSKIAGAMSFDAGNHPAAQKYYML